MEILLGTVVIIGAMIGFSFLKRRNQELNDHYPFDPDSKKVRK